MKLGIIGNGFVGNAIYHNFKNDYDLLIYDKEESKANVESIREVCHSSKIIFVAVPTPMLSTGKCDLSIIFNVMAQISYWYNDNIIVLKSTVPPGTSEAIMDIHKDLRIVFSPEFLTEKNSINDFKECNRVVFGGKDDDVEECISAFSRVFPDKKYLKTNWKSAEMVKYFINSFLATKVSFANEMNQICEAVGIEYSEVKDLALYDNRIGKSHLMVPGPDGSLGFGGTCFPKDLNCLMYFAVEQGIDPLMIASTWMKNTMVREDHDWLSKPGRAVSEEKDIVRGTMNIGTMTAGSFDDSIDRS
tara:strand:- start:318 stop:1226 length:909 start_codon:yes stop_codon:yes gene_type:complete